MCCILCVEGEERLYSMNFTYGYRARQNRSRGRVCLAGFSYTAGSLDSIGWALLGVRRGKDREREKDQKDFHIRLQSLMDRKSGTVLL